MNQLEIVENLNPLQINQLLKLTQQMWWSKDRTLNDVKKMLSTSISFGLIDSKSKKLVGYARVLTDEIKYAFIFDVMIKEDYRGKGLSKLIMEAIFKHPKLQDVTRFDLTCEPHMIPFYEKFNFSTQYGNTVPMRRIRSKS